MHLNKVDLTTEGRRYVGYQAEHEGALAECFDIIEPDETPRVSLWAHMATRAIEACLVEANKVEDEQ